MINGNLALKEIQDKPAFNLVIVTKPTPQVCPSALRESKARFIQSGRVFEEMERKRERTEIQGLAQHSLSSAFQDLQTGQTYHLMVIMNVIENQVFTASFINRKAISTQDYSVNPQFAGRSMSCLANEEQALLGGFGYLQDLVMRGKV